MFAHFFIYYILSFFPPAFFQFQILSKKFLINKSLFYYYTYISSISAELQVGGFIKDGIKFKYIIPLPHIVQHS